MAALGGSSVCGIVFPRVPSTPPGCLAVPVPGSLFRWEDVSTSYVLVGLSEHMLTGRDCLLGAGGFVDREFSRPGM